MAEGCPRRSQQIWGARLPTWVNNGPDGPETRLLLCTDQRTSADRPGMSQRCQHATWHRLLIWPNVAISWRVEGPTLAAARFHPDHCQMNVLRATCTARCPDCREHVGRLREE